MILLLGIDPRKYNLKFKEIAAPMFTAALSTVDKIWKYPECPLMDKWMKMWFSIQWNIIQP